MSIEKNTHTNHQALHLQASEYTVYKRGATTGLLLLCCCVVIVERFPINPGLLVIAEGCVTPSDVYRSAFPSGSTPTSGLKHAYHSKISAACNTNAATAGISWTWYPYSSGNRYPDGRSCWSQALLCWLECNMFSKEHRQPKQQNKKSSPGASTMPAFWKTSVWHRHSRRVLLSGPHSSSCYLPWLLAVLSTAKSQRVLSVKSRRRKENV